MFLYSFLWWRAREPIVSTILKSLLQIRLHFHSLMQQTLWVSQWLNRSSYCLASSAFCSLRFASFITSKGIARMPNPANTLGWNSLTAPPPVQHSCISFWILTREKHFSSQLLLTSMGPLHLGFRFLGCLYEMEPCEGVAFIRLALHGMIILGRLRTWYLLSPWSGCLSDPNMALKTWGFLKNLTPHRKLRDTGSNCQSRWCKEKDHWPKSSWKINLIKQLINVSIFLPVHGLPLPKEGFKSAVLNMGMISVSMAEGTGFSNGGFVRQSQGYRSKTKQFGHNHFLWNRHGCKVVITRES